MRVIGKTELEEFGGNHADALPAITSWLAEAEVAEWKTPHEVKERYASVSTVRQGLTVFNLKGNKYRLVTVINYRRQTIRVKRVMTHADYTKRGVE